MFQEAWLGKMKVSSSFHAKHHHQHKTTPLELLSFNPLAEQHHTLIDGEGQCNKCICKT
jgi:hypothetical protein